MSMWLLALGVMIAPAAILLLARRRRSPAPALRWLEVAELRAWLAAGRTVTIVDVRGPDEFTGPLGHIAGARNLPLDSLPARLPELAHERGRPLVLVCRTDKRSATAATLVMSAGHADVFVVRGGMERWTGTAAANEGTSGSGR